MISLAKSTPSRQAFTVLELMIALALLGALLAVAWSILGSYRSAEQRGWDQAYRMQIVRTARELLETDAAHWDDISAIDAFAANPEIDAFSAAFVGDEEGFKVVMLPSLDPLPWLEEITDSVEGTTTLGEDATPRSEASVTQDRRIDQTEGPLDRVQLRYEVVRDSSGVDAAPLAHLRRQRTPLGQSSGDSTFGSEDASAADRLLTVDDLYRSTESDGLESSQATNTILVRNLVAPRFRYSDGSEWFSHWDAREHGGLPRAIELSFDHPRANSPYRVNVESESNAGLVSAGASEAAVQAGDERDVRIVVHVPAGIALTEAPN